MWEYNHTNELFHYGIPGMRWGKRRRAKKEAKREAVRQDTIRDVKRSKYGKTATDSYGSAILKGSVASATLGAASKLSLKGKKNTAAALTVVGLGVGASGAADLGRATVQSMLNVRDIFKKEK